MSYVIEYDRNRFPILKKREDGTYGCRGCGSDIPKGRQTWCSRDCSHKYHPTYVISAVVKRDKGICQICGVDHKKLEADWWKAKPDYLKAGWAAHSKWMSSRPTPEYDHIIPFSEGGMTILSNMRTLCSACHKKRTKQWHKEKKQRGKATPELALD